MASRDVSKGDLALILKCGRFPQIFELGGISLLNYNQTKKLNDLPRSIVHYDGDAPDAAWRKAAAERIEKYRKAPLTVKVVDASGKPVSGAEVSVKMTKSTFAWGTATASQRILDTNDPNSKFYRDTLLRYFNKVVLENEMKAQNWSRFNETQTQNGINWFKSHDIPVRGHVMVWPSWQHSPHLEKYKADKEALSSAIFTQINEQTTKMKGQFTEWDVINEPYAHHSIIDSLGGSEVMVKWFQAARKNLPDVKLFLNDYTMFHAEKAGSDHFYNTVKFLKEKGAPIDGIGEQGHIGGTPPGIEYILSRLDRFAEFGLPIQISEFDITSDDDDFKARYLRDFMTAIFSHPSTTGLIQWGFWEGQHWIPAGALWDKNWNVRPHGKVFTELVSKTWWTDVMGKTAKDGVISLSGFLGNYDIRVIFKGKTYRQTYTLDSKGGTVQVNINK
jgi:GH35 family endo-1,4-beta-xylanase